MHIFCIWICVGGDQIHKGDVFIWISRLDFVKSYYRVRSSDLSMACASIAYHVPICMLLYDEQCRNCVICGMYVHSFCIQCKILYFCSHCKISKSYFIDVRVDCIRF